MKRGDMVWVKAKFIGYQFKKDWTNIRVLGLSGFYKPTTVYKSSIQQIGAGQTMIPLEQKRWVPVRMALGWTNKQMWEVFSKIITITIREKRGRKG